VSKMVASELSVNRFLLAVDTACAPAVKLPLDHSRIFSAGYSSAEESLLRPFPGHKPAKATVVQPGAGAEGSFHIGGLVMDHSQQRKYGDSARTRALTGQTAAFGGSFNGAF